MAKDDPHFRLRIPADLKARIERHAATNKRSINAEITSTLDRVYQNERPNEELWGTVGKLPPEARDKAVDLIAQFGILLSQNHLFKEFLSGPENSEEK